MTHIPSPSLPAQIDCECSQAGDEACAAGIKRAMELTYGKDDADGAAATAAATTSGSALQTARFGAPAEWAPMEPTDRAFFRVNRVVSAALVRWVAQTGHALLATVLEQARGGDAGPLLQGNLPYNVVSFLTSCGMCVCCCGFPVVLSPIFLPPPAAVVPPCAVDSLRFCECDAPVSEKPRVLTSLVTGLRKRQRRRRRSQQRFRRRTTAPRPNRRASPRRARAAARSRSSRFRSAWPPSK